MFYATELIGPSYFCNLKMKIFAETKRLILREVIPSDVEGFYELDTDPLVHQYLGNKPLTNKQQCKDIIDFIREQYLKFGIGRWAIIEKSSNNFIGWTGLKFVNEPINQESNYYDLGYRIIRKHWGRGFATESAIASLNYGFNQLELVNIYASAHINNIASNRILTKLDFKLLNTFHFDNAFHNWYCISKDEWKIYNNS